jgi:V/A-type H+/Na+-transporting ATPase subunit F
MTKLAAYGSNEFVIGFRLAGIKDTFVASNDIVSDIEKIKQDDISIVVIDENILKNVKEHERDEIEDSINPVFIPLSTEVKQENLRKMIKRSIGVDLWKE